MVDQVMDAPAEGHEETEIVATHGKRSGPRWIWLALLAILAVGGLGAVKYWGLSALSDPDGLPGGGDAVLLRGTSRATTLTAGMPAADFTLATLDGGTASLQDYRGQVVLVNFWATWCPPCRADMPDMEQVYRERNDQGFAVLAVNVQEAKEPIAGFVRRYGLPFPIPLDVDGEAVQQYEVYTLPSSYFIDRECRVAEVHVGPLNKAAISAKVDKLLR